MKVICHDCYMKLADIDFKAQDEVRARLDRGERVETLYVEYSNEKNGLFKAEESEGNQERYWFVKFAADYCIRDMGLTLVIKAGWGKNRSGDWIWKG